jgi:uncharacterized membrane protein YdjX (TVP38/TMEM64 family)
MKTSTSIRWALIVLLVAAVAAGFYFLPQTRERVEAFLDRVDELGAWGPVLLGAIYIPACVLMVPGSLLTLGAGYAFGLVRGLLAVSAGSTLGACAAFLISRYLARDWIERKVAGNPKFRAVDRAVGRQGFQIVLLTRLSPIFPFNALNYAYGLTGISLPRYALASWLGMLPGTIMYVYFGSAAKDLADVASGRAAARPASQVFFYLGLVLAVVVSVLVARIARAALAEVVGEDE